MNSDDVSLIPLSAEDEAFLREMLYLALYVPQGQPPFPRSILDLPEIAHYVSHWGRPGDLGLAAVVKGEKVGAVWLRLFPTADPGYGFVDETTPELSIAVLPAYRGLGIGERLISAVLDLAGETYSAVSLSVSTENPATRLYQLLGFSVAASQGDSLTMFKKIKELKK